jgi:hypothetical protein
MEAFQTVAGIDMGRRILEQRADSGAGRRAMHSLVGKWA